MSKMISRYFGLCLLCIIIGGIVSASEASSIYPEDIRKHYQLFRFYSEVTDLCTESEGWGNLASLLREGECSNFHEDIKFGTRSEDRSWLQGFYGTYLALKYYGGYTDLTQIKRFLYDTERMLELTQRFLNKYIKYKTIFVNYDPLEYGVFLRSASLMGIATYFLEFLGEISNAKGDDAIELVDRFVSTHSLFGMRSEFDDQILKGAGKFWEKALNDRPDAFVYHEFLKGNLYTSEASKDQVLGLLTGLFMIYYYVDDTEVRDRIRSIVEQIDRTIKDKFLGYELERPSFTVSILGRPTVVIPKRSYRYAPQIRDYWTGVKPALDYILKDEININSGEVNFLINDYFGMWGRANRYRYGFSGLDDLFAFNNDFFQLLIVATLKKEMAQKIISGLDNPDIQGLRHLNLAALYMYCRKRWNLEGASGKHYLRVLDRDLHHYPRHVPPYHVDAPEQIRDFHITASWDGVKTDWGVTRFQGEDAEEARDWTFVRTQQWADTIKVNLPEVKFYVRDDPDEWINPHGYFSIRHGLEVCMPSPVGCLNIPVADTHLRFDSIFVEDPDPNWIENLDNEEAKIKVGLFNGGDLEPWNLQFGDSWSQQKNPPTTFQMLIDVSNKEDETGTGRIKIAEGIPFLTRFSMREYGFENLDKYLYSAYTEFTPVGSNVDVLIGDHAVTFDTVTTKGITDIWTDTSGPALPANFVQICTPPQYFNIQTTSIYSGNIEICLTYDDSICDEVDLRLLHYEDGWTDVTDYPVDKTNNIICGIVSSLSPFVLASPVNQPPVALCQDVTIPTDPAFCTADASIDAGSFDPDDDLFTMEQVPPSPYYMGITDVQLTVTDDEGLFSSCNADVNVEDNEAPLVVAKDITVQLDASGNASIAAGDVDNGSSDNCGIASLSVSPSSFTCANVGANTVTLTVTDINGNSSSATATVTVEDNVAPTAVAQGITVQLDASGNASITAAQVDNGSSDNCGVASLSVSPSSFTCSDMGSNTVTLTVTDVNGNVSSTTATVKVIDQEPPVINNLTANPNTLWPPNHKMKPVTVTADVSDNCDPDPICKITSVSSNEPEDGTGKDDKSPDWEITGDLTLNLRAERAGGGSGRVYTFTVECTDPSGNSATETTEVTVPHDKGKKK